jgi:hypothetical protein
MAHMRSLVLMLLVLATTGGTPAIPSGERPGVAQIRSSESGLEVDQYQNLHVLVSLANSAGIDLSAQRIQTRIELKLRQAGLKPDKRQDATFLEVVVNVIPTCGPPPSNCNAFSETVNFRRTVAYFVGGAAVQSFGAATWTTGQTGTFGRDPAYLLGALDESIEEFLNAYLKANQR